jgi:hypothetical protein
VADEMIMVLRFSFTKKKAWYAGITTVPLLVGMLRVAAMVNRGAFLRVYIDMMMGYYGMEKDHKPRCCHRYYAYFGIFSQL